MANKTFDEDRVAAMDTSEVLNAESFDKRGWQHKQDKNHNLSIEEKMTIKRPKTSQGVRASGSGF